VSGARSAAVVVAGLAVAVVAALLTIASMGILTYKGATAKESLASENVALVPDWVKKQNLKGQAVAGAKLFAEVGCMNCHTYLGAGSSNLGAPDLSAIGTTGQPLDFFKTQIKCPQCNNPSSPMQPFPNLSDQQLTALANFLINSKGSGGGG
jgi:cytochrome c1